MHWLKTWLHVCVGDLISPEAPPHSSHRKPVFSRFKSLWWMFRDWRRFRFIYMKWIKCNLCNLSVKYNKIYPGISSVCLENAENRDVWFIHFIPFCSCRSVQNINTVCLWGSCCCCCLHFAEHYSVTVIWSDLQSRKVWSQSLITTGEWTC